MYEDDLLELEDGIRKLKVEYDIFFNGNRKKPPDDLRFRVEKLIRRLSESSMAFQERFRFNTLVARFYVYRDLWRRSQGEREVAATARNVASSTRAASDASSGQAPGPGISISITDPGKEEEKVRRLYDTLLQIRNRDANSAPSMSYPQFAKFIESQTRGIRAKSGCSSVVFTLAVQEDAIKFLARADNKSD